MESRALLCLALRASVLDLVAFMRFTLFKTKHQTVNIMHKTYLPQDDVPSLKKQQLYQNAFSFHLHAL
ncbi:hypothetical protein Hanom_Chr11g00989481 [Helianthus anomalus]